MKRAISSIIVLVLFFSMIIHTANASSYPTIKSMKPTNGNYETPIDSEIYVEFNSKIVTFDSSKISIKRKQTSSSYVKEDIKEIKINDQKLVITLENELIFNKDYVLTIEAYAVELQNGYYKSIIKNNFKTNYISFHDLMVVDQAKLKSLLESYTPRQLKVTAPERYVEEVIINHKKKGVAENDENKTITEALTNVDILVKNNGAGVSKVLVDVIYGGKRIARNYASKESITGNTNTQATYSVGFGDLPPTFDVKITVFDSTLYIMDELLLKVASEDGKLFTIINEKYKYETPGNTYSLHKLVTDEKLFNALLIENNLKKIMVQVDR